MLVHSTLAAVGDKGGAPGGAARAEMVRIVSSEQPRANELSAPASGERPGREASATPVSRVSAAPQTWIESSEQPHVKQPQLARKEASHVLVHAMLDRRVNNREGGADYTQKPPRGTRLSGSRRRTGVVAAAAMADPLVL